jgi:predicted transposase YbfD/YdcC
VLFSPKQTHVTVEKGHGRIEERTIKVLSIEPGQVDFPFASQIFQIERKFTATAKGKSSCEVVCGITSLTEKKATPARLLEFNRGQWTIENKVHYVRDVTMAEDQSRIRKGQSPRVMATLRNLTLNLLRLAGITNISETLQRFAFDRRELFKFAKIGCCASQ